MCGRYSLASTAELVRETFDVDESADLEPRWNVAPTQEAPVVRLGASGRRRIHLLRWGLIARGATSPAGGQINARSETVETLPAFRDAFRQRRCLVPADGFYEWLRLEGRRHPFHIRRRDRLPFAFAGLWNQRGEPSASPDVAERAAFPRDARGGSFTILTCPPNDLVRPLHDRMPVILPAVAWKIWLSLEADPAELHALLVPWTGDELEAVAVSSAVNRVDHEGSDCVREVPRPVARQLSLLPS